MKISDLDKNLEIKTSINADLRWFTPLEEPFKLHGLYGYTEELGYTRLPHEVAKNTNGGVEWLHRCTAGGRIRFKSNTKNIAVKVYVTSSGIMPHITAVGQSGLDIYITENGKHRYVQSLMPAFQQEGDCYYYETIAYVNGQMNNYTLNMPLYSDVKSIYIGLDPDAVIEPADRYTITQPVLYYGSSITQDGCASRPGNGYQAMISRRFDCDFINLGFSGSARGEKAIVDYLASLDPCIFVLDYDHNAPNADHLEATHEPLFMTFRAAHPDTPVIMVSKPDFHPHTEDERRREIIRTTYNNAVARGDQNVYFIDGETLFEGDCRDSCTVDGCHPNDLGFYRMAKVIGDVMAPLMEKIKIQ